MKRTNRPDGFMLVYWLLAVAAVFVFAVWTGQAHGDVYDATCRVKAGNSGGSGTVFEVSRGNVYVLTNAHVVEGVQQVTCEFWRSGHISRPIAGQVYARRLTNTVDAAVIAIPQTSFGGILPRAIPMAPRGYQLEAGDEICSAGCANGSWVTAFRGHVQGWSADRDMLFVPPPANGRSGSAICTADGSMIVGLLRARGDGYGVACSLPNMYEQLTAACEEREVQRICPPGGCQIPGYGPSGPGGPGNAPNPYWLPHRREQDKYRQEQEWEKYQYRQDLERRVWPTLPQGQLQVAPPQPGRSPRSVDLGPTNEKIDAMRQSLDELIEILKLKPQEPELAPIPDPFPSMPQMPQMPVSDPAAQAALAKVEEVAATTAAALEAQEEERVALAQALADAGSLRERYTARLAKIEFDLGDDAGRREKFQAYAKDYLSDKLAGGAGAGAGFSIMKIVFGAMGVSMPVMFGLGLAGWLIGRRIGRKVRSGEDTLIERLLDRMGQDELSDRIGARLDRRFGVQPEPEPEPVVAPKKKAK